MAATAIVVSVSSQQYHYDQGTYYVASTSTGSSGYVVVQAPVGATVSTLPQGAETVTMDSTSGWYYGGAYYEKTKDGYQVVAPVAGTVVQNLPDGGKEVKIGDQTYVQVGDTFYQPIQQDGKNMYEVVQVEAEKG
jgi:biotin carboxyl carrier protein